MWCCVTDGLTGDRGNNNNNNNNIIIIIIIISFPFIVYRYSTIDLEVAIKYSISFDTLSN
jgi:hypothetical protein